MVLQMVPVGINVIHQRDQLLMLKTFVAEQLPHMRPVFLLHMGVVIFAIRTAAGKLYLTPGSAQVFPTKAS